MKRTPWILLISLAGMGIGLSQTHDPLLERMPAIFEQASSQYAGMLEKLAQDTKLPRSVKPDGTLITTEAEDWTSGFFPGCLWLLYEYTGAIEWKNRALDYTQRLERIRHFKDHHDTGFMLGCSYGNALRLCPDDAQRAVLRDGAAALASRFVPDLGMIRSWDSKPYICPVIIDNMMNLELLTWAAKNGGDAKFRDIAISHADKTLAQHFRADGSAYHVVDYDPQTGWVRAIYANQGADVRTPWARGQSWAIYGFTMMHHETGKKEYLAKASTLADFLIAHPHMPADKVPLWDYGQPLDDSTPRDASAGAIMASALVELCESASNGQKYRDFAREQLLTLASPAFFATPGTNGGFLLTRSTGHLPGHAEINVPLVYADYYFLEALLRYKALVTKTKRITFGDAR